LGNLDPSAEFPRLRREEDEKEVDAPIHTQAAEVESDSPPLPFVLVSAMLAKSGPIEAVKDVASHHHPTILAKRDLHDEGSVDPVYQAKAHVLNQALQEIGMGKYQVHIPVCVPSRTL